MTPTSGTTITWTFPTWQLGGAAQHEGRLADEPAGEPGELQTWANGYWRYFWFNTWTCITSQCSGRQTGAYGYQRYREFSTIGDVSSDNQALFFQDTWRVSRKLTLNLGIRTEREYLPSFASDTSIPSRAIEFPWSEKFSPKAGLRLGSQGRWQAANLCVVGPVLRHHEVRTAPRQLRRRHLARLLLHAGRSAGRGENLRVSRRTARRSGAASWRSINWRIPSNDPNDNTIDPNLKPMKQRMLDIGYDAASIRASWLRRGTRTAG
jgi:hypothetical protein